MSDELTAAERRYFESRGADASGLGYVPAATVRPRLPAILYGTGKTYLDGMSVGKTWSLHFWRKWINGIPQHYGHLTLGYMTNPETGKLTFQRRFKWEV